MVEGKVCRFFDSVGSFFSGAADNMPWCDRQLIADCEREVAEKTFNDIRSDSIMRLSWALVHSRQPEDVHRGIGMLEASLDSPTIPLKRKEKLYLLAVGYFRSEDFPRSRQLVGMCLEIQPDWRQALTLKKVVEDRIARDGIIGIGIAATAGGVVVIGGIVAALTRKR